MKPEGSLPCSQELLASILGQTNQVHVIKPYFFKNYLILYSSLRIRLQSALFLSGYLDNILHAFNIPSMLSTCITYLIILHTIT
jgi:hypothetical protein